MNKILEFRAWDKTLLKMLPARSLVDIAKSDMSDVNFDQLIIMQYTGLHSNNKPLRKIYEGDIIKGKFSLPKLVSFKHGQFIAIDIKDKKLTENYQSLNNALPSKVVGNIYEDMELLTDIN